MGSSPDTGWAPSKSKNKPHFPLLLAKSKPHFPLPWGVYEYPSQGSAPTFADVLILQPELPLDLPVGIPDGAGFLKAIHCLLDVVVAKLVQQRHKISTGGGSIQRVKCIAEGWEGNGRDAQFPEPTKPLLPPYTLAIGNQALSPSPAKKGYVTSCHPFSPYSPCPCTLTLGDGHLVEPDMVHNRLHLPVLQEGIPRHLTEVHHACHRKDTGTQCHC